MIKILFSLLFCFACAQSLWANNICAICGKPIFGPIYSMTDQETGDKFLVCSNCLMLPRCYICGRPVDDSGMILPDGRHLCARDAKLVILDTNAVLQICGDVQEDLNRLFSRFATFPTNVDFSVIDRIDEASLLHENGNDFESPNLLGCIQTVTNDFDAVRYSIRLMSGLPAAELKATCAHEFSHAWAAANIPKARHKRIARDAEEGFCEMVAYLLMDSQNETAQKKFILRNHYTRGQVALFIDAEKNYGFEQILEWMKYGAASRLNAENPGEIRDVNRTTSRNVALNFVSTHSPLKADIFQTNKISAATSAPATLKLEGIFWSSRPLAIINGDTFAPGDENKIRFGATNIVVRCVSIGKNFVRIREMNSGVERKLSLPAH